MIEHRHGLQILRVAVLNNAAFEWYVLTCYSYHSTHELPEYYADRIEHEAIGRRAGLSTAQLLEIRLTPPFGTSLIAHKDLTPQLSAALLFADWSTKEVKVPQAIFDGLKQYLNDRQMVEAVATVAAYNMVSRVLVAFDVNGKADVQVPIPQ